MAQLQKYKDDFVILLESGFIAASQTDEDAAVKLFRAAQILQPENVMPKVGYGYIHLLKLELNQACKRFEEVLKADPHNEMARAMLGLSTSLTVKDADKGEKILKEAMKNTKAAARSRNRNSDCEGCPGDLAWEGTCPPERGGRHKAGHDKPCHDIALGDNIG